MSFKYKVGDRVRFTNGEEAVIEKILRNGHGYDVGFDSYINLKIDSVNKQNFGDYVFDGNVAYCSQDGNHIVGLTTQPQEKPMQTVAEFIKDLPIGTVMTDGVREWEVCIFGLKRSIRHQNSPIGHCSSECEYIVIPNLHVKKRKVLKGRVLYCNLDTGKYLLTVDTYTEKEFNTAFPTRSGIKFERILTEVPEFLTEEVEEE